MATTLILARATIGEQVRAARRRYGMTQAELARRAGMSKTSMNNIEQGLTSDPGWSLVVRIAQVLGVSLDALAGLSDDRNNGRAAG